MELGGCREAQWHKFCGWNCESLRKCIDKRTFCEDLVGLGLGDTLDRNELFLGGESNGFDGMESRWIR